MFRRIVSARGLGNGFATYVQGQYPKSGGREYFYYIDHQGMLFLDDSPMKNFTSCFKEVKFLDFFFRCLRLNNLGRYEEFPYLSPCGKENNYVHCDDLPVVFTGLHELGGQKYLLRNYCSTKLAVPFQPEKIFMSCTGRVYHPGPENLGGVGLIASRIAVEFSEGFSGHGGLFPERFTYDGKTYDLDGSLKEKVNKFANKLSFCDL